MKNDIKITPVKMRRPNNSFATQKILRESYFKKDNVMKKTNDYPDW